MSLARGGICGAGAESAVYDVGEVVAPDGDGVVGYFGGVPAVGEERSQWRIAPSEPPETRIRCTGCHARAIEGKVSMGPWPLKRGRQDVQLLFCAHAERFTPSWSEYRRLALSGREIRLRAGSHVDPMRALGPDSLLMTRAASCQHVCLYY